MVNKMLNYLKNARIERIDYLLRPERMRHKGCLYLIAKFFIMLFAVGLGSSPLHWQAIIENALPQSAHIISGILLGVLSLVLIVALLLFALNELDRLWRKKEDEKYDGHELNLKDMLQEYSESQALNSYNKEIIERLIKNHDDLNTGFKDLRAKQLALIEDAILYRYEINEIMHPLAYGVKIIVLATLFVTCATFASLYEPIQDFWRDQFPYDSGLGILYVIFPLGIFCAWRAYVRAKDLWRFLGPHGRNTARNILFYWPITLVFLIILNTWAHIN